MSATTFAWIIIGWIGLSFTLVGIWCLCVWNGDRCARRVARREASHE